MSLEEIHSAELPLNRKERFFTGTVFPMITCKDNFAHLHILMSLLGVSPIPTIVANPDETNIQFFTEYSLQEPPKFFSPNLLPLVGRNQLGME